MTRRDDDSDAFKDDHSRESSDSFEFAEPDEPLNNSYAISSRISRHVPNISIPQWVPVRTFTQLNPRYLVFGVVVSLIVTALIFNPYRPSRQTNHDDKSSPSSGTATTTAAVSSPTPKPPPKPIHKPPPAPEKSSYQAYKRPLPVPNDDHCTTWPLDKKNLYKPDPKTMASPVQLDSYAPQGGWEKPDGVKVVAMVFYGRKRYVDILDCYLQQNLVSNGGYLDEVWFMDHTEDEDDKAWLEGLVLANPYYLIKGRGHCDHNDKKYGCMWEYATEDNTIYIKIDDDILYIHHDAIPQLVHTRLAVPHAFGVSAQLINSPITGMEQFHHNAIYPFVPDPHPQPGRSAAAGWRMSQMDKFPKDKLEEFKQQTKDEVMYPKAPYRGHPFLLLSDDNYDNLKTSMGKYDQDPGGEFIAFSPVWKSWTMAAQQQYSLLYNLERNQVSRYFYGTPATYPTNAKGPNSTATVHLQGDSLPGGEQVFDTQFRRYNLNFVAVWGADIKEHLPIQDDDEDAITKLIPQKTGRPFIIDTRSVVSHFSFFTQSAEIRKTDLLDRWRAYANEAVCARDNLKAPWDLQCPGFKGLKFWQRW
ncbi:hypothetical protein F5Y16DRAFT_390786 [Xylariaceae sp. FL0255]|nr:hypothetical protein F5Y16DRAFT_390786 [Xylariaceae sp. FL0255]